jgi:hypothetical protein
MIFDVRIVLVKWVNPLQFSLKLNKNNEHIAGRPTCVSVHEVTRCGIPSQTGVHELMCRNLL